MKKFKNRKELDNYEKAWSKNYALKNHLDWYDVKFDWDGTITKKFVNHLIEQGYNLDDLLENDDKYEICGHTNPDNKKQNRECKEENNGKI